MDIEPENHFTPADVMKFALKNGEGLYPLQKVFPSALNREDAAKRKPSYPFLAALVNVEARLKQLQGFEENDHITKLLKQFKIKSFSLEDLTNPESLTWSTAHFPEGRDPLAEFVSKITQNSPNTYRGRVRLTYNGKKMYALALGVYPLHETDTLTHLDHGWIYIPLDTYPERINFSKIDLPKELEWLKDLNKGFSKGTRNQRENMYKD